jgi:hypothetical protein
MWASLVARSLGFERDEALTMGRAVAGLNAYAKGKSLGLYRPEPETVSGERRRLEAGGVLLVELLNRAVPVVRTPEGLRALSKGRPVAPESVQRYLESKFGGALSSFEGAMMHLAHSLPPADLTARAYELYEALRPRVPYGIHGWGAAGELDIERIHGLAESHEALILAAHTRGVGSNRLLAEPNEDAISRAAREIELG